MDSCLVIGGGVIGLSVAYELLRRRCRVRLIDRAILGAEASWAGAGILPPASAATALHPLDQLRALSNHLHPQWAKRLLAETGIDNGYRRCGGLYLARTSGEAASLAGMAQTLQAEQVVCRRLAAEELMALEPGLEHLATSGELRAAYELPDECQLRNPRHLQALASACRKLGGGLIEDCEAVEFIHDEKRIRSVGTTRGEMAADAYVIACGAWTQRLLAREKIATSIFPVRGQMVLFRCEQPPFRRVLNEGSRYLVPRDDGRVLAGSTEEEVGFDKSNTAEGIAGLTEFAVNLVPALRKAAIERAWAGLRPASFDGFPYIGRLPALENAFVAAGHFRSGLHLSTGTAVVLAQLMCDETLQIDLTPFRVARG